MLGKKVLISYGTRFGATEEVANEIAKVLENRGINSRLVNLRKIKPRDWPSPDEFDGIIIASGIRINKWTKEPKKYLVKYKEVLKEPEKLLGMFVCSAYAVTEHEEAVRIYLEDTLVELGIPNDDKVLYEAFGGVFDFSKDSILGFVDKNMLKMAAMGIEKGSNGEVKIDKDGRTDFRDWGQIREFASKFAALINS
ncbi:MAG: flavodoxin domain-containing protein [Candidatus Odinarchaeota archaeon]